MAAEGQLLAGGAGRLLLLLLFAWLAGLLACWLANTELLLLLLSLLLHLPCLQVDDGYLLNCSIKVL
jgi:hypothetical protein